MAGAIEPRFAARIRFTKVPRWQAELLAWPHVPTSLEGRQGDVDVGVSTEGFRATLGFDQAPDMNQIVAAHERERTPPLE